MPYDLLKENIKRNVQISDADLDAICKYFKPRMVEKGDFLLTQGSVYKYEGFVVDGYLGITHEFLSKIKRKNQQKK